MGFLLLPLFRTTEDGSCLYNACSIALIGDETLSMCLRSFTCCELYLYADSNASHPILNYLESQNFVSNKNNAFVLEKGNHLTAVYGEAQYIARNFRFSSFLCLLAISSVIGLPIEAYYPINCDA